MPRFLSSPRGIPFSRVSSAQCKTLLERNKDLPGTPTGRMVLPCTVALWYPFSLSENTICLVWGPGNHVGNRGTSGSQQLSLTLSDSVPWPLGQRFKYLYSAYFLRLRQAIKL